MTKNDLAKRVVTLSPLTDMARRFHLKNGAKEIATGLVAANFEYPVRPAVQGDEWYQSTETADWSCTAYGEQS